MAAILECCDGMPEASFEAGSELLVEGAKLGALYVLIEGAVEILKGDLRINTVDEAGALIGEVSVLLDIPPTATVRALTPCRVYQVENGDAFLRANPGLAYHVSKLLAQRLHHLTTYVAGT